MTVIKPKGKLRPINIFPASQSRFPETVTASVQIYFKDEDGNTWKTHAEIGRSELTLSHKASNKETCYRCWPTYNEECEFCKRLNDGTD